MAAGDILPDGTIKLAPNEGHHQFARGGRVMISRDKIAEAEQHGWHVIAESDEEVAAVVGRSTIGLVIVQRDEQ